jgi:dTDP-4-dehydrorhamnose 3,5-epimerase
MRVTEIGLKDVLVFEPRVFGDLRGWFVELYAQERYTEAGLPPFIQDNMSRSVKGTLRGLHFQREHTQGKLVWAVEGEIVDVVVDCREGSPSFGRYELVPLDGVSKRQIWVPPGYAHGFCVVSDFAIVQYKVTDIWHPASETGVRWDDPTLAIPWPVEAPILSPKDLELPLWDATPKFRYGG